jgi:hypothetical protein
MAFSTGSINKNDVCDVDRMVTGHCSSGTILRFLIALHLSQELDGHSRSLVASCPIVTRT